MRKLPTHYEDPVDVALYDRCEELSDVFFKYGHTPNMLTTYSLICGLVAAYFLYNRNIAGFVLFYSMCYFFDCFDGFFARKYKITSEFGDLYDHINDMIQIIIVIVVLWLRYREHISWGNLLFVGLFCLLLFSYTGCAQKYYTQTKPDRMKEVLDHHQVFCRNTDDLKWLRYFGPGMVHLVAMCMIMYVWYKWCGNKK